MNLPDVDRECPVFNSTLGNARRGPLNLPLNVGPYPYLCVPFLMIYQCGVLSSLSRSGFLAANGSLECYIDWTCGGGPSKRRHGAGWGWCGTIHWNGTFTFVHCVSSLWFLSDISFVYQLAVSNRISASVCSTWNRRLSPEIKTLRWMTPQHHLPPPPPPP